MGVCLSAYFFNGESRGTKKFRRKTEENEGFLTSNLAGPMKTHSNTRPQQTGQSILERSTHRQLYFHRLDLILFSEKNKKTRLGWKAVETILTTRASKMSRK